MPLADRSGRYLPYLFLALLFATTIAFRPLLPVDETRYLTVSWEMLLNNSFVVPTMNFEPYFQKPPMLFWLIDIVWSVFGVSRIAALLVVFGASCLFIHLTVRLARALLPEADGLVERVPWLMLGNVAFLIYSSMILFDILLTDFVLAALLSFLAFAKGRGLRFAVLSGLFIGLGVLTKGPVVLIHIGWPLVLYPLWRDRQTGLEPRRFFGGVALSALVALAVAFLWLVPLIARMGSDFAYSLIWKQAAGRVAGTLQASHARPVYFYILLLPVAALPWLLSPYLWNRKALLRRQNRADIPVHEQTVLRFLALWFAGVLVTFSLISGKQPHYLVPLLPLVTIGLGYLMTRVPAAQIRYTAIGMLIGAGIGQAVASQTAFRNYDLAPLADYVRLRQEADWAYAGNYQGQLGFLARLQKPVETVEKEDADGWLAAHPHGYLIKRFRQPPQASDGVDFTVPTERGYLGVLPGRNTPETAAAQR